MLRRVHKPDAMFGGSQKLSATAHGLQDPSFAFLAQIIRGSELLGDPGHQPCRLMGVELIEDKYPLVMGSRSYGLGDVRHEVGFGACCPQTRRLGFSGCDLEVGDQTLGAVTNVLVLLAFVLTTLPTHVRLHRLGLGGAFECWNAGLFVRTQQMNALFV